MAGKESSTEKDGSEMEISNATSSGQNRFNMFKVVMKNLIGEVSSSVSEQDYVKLFGDLTALKKSKSAPIKMRNTLKTKLAETLNSELELLMEEEEFEKAFSELDGIIEANALFEGTDTWRPNGNENDHVRSHVMEKKLEHKRALQEYVREQEKEVEMLKQQVSDSRARFQRVVAAFHQLKNSAFDTSAMDEIEEKMSQLQ